MRRLVLQVMAGVIVLLALSGQAPKPKSDATSKAKTDAVAAAVAVTVLTDSLVEPTSRAARAVNELAERPAAIGNIRVLPIAGQGATANVRDLLYLRGVDLAILNSDILEYLDQTRQYPDARTRIRYVTHLFDQKVYLLARKDIAAVGDLRGRKLAILSKGGSSQITATTLLGLLKINVASLEPLGSDAILDDASLGKFDGALVLSDELARVRLTSRQEWRVLPIQLTPALAKAYGPAVIEAQELAGFAHAGKVDTVVVSTLLAVYNWVPTQGVRHVNVTSFMQALFSALPGLRQQNSGAAWRQADINAKLPGWTRHAEAAPARALAKAQLAELAAVERSQAVLPPPPPQPTAAPSPPPPAKAEKPKIRVLAVGRAPLADEGLSDGGLITVLVRASLSTGEPGGAAPSDIELRWTKAALPPIRSLLGDPTVDISWPWEGADCERPNDLVQASAVLCDNAVYSDPVLQVVVGLFTLADSTFRFETDESIYGKTICVPQDQDVSVLNGHGRNWLSEKRVAAIRQPTLLDCASAVQRREADAFIANDLEGRYVLDRLGLAQDYKMAERPLGTRGIHAIVSREHPHASELINAVNQGLKRLKQSDAYGAIVRRHLMRLWETKTSTP